MKNCRNIAIPSAISRTRPNDRHRAASLLRDLGHGYPGLQARGLRDMAMALVQAFPAERGRMMAAQMEIEGGEQSQFGTR